jgi:hypothetical protein
MGWGLWDPFPSTRHRALPSLMEPSLGGLEAASSLVVATSPTPCSAVPGAGSDAGQAERDREADGA